MVYTKIELFFSHTTVRLISWQKKRLGLRFGPPCTYNNRVLSDGSELQRQNNWQTRRPRQLSKLTTTIYRTRAPFRPSLCCSCNLSQSLLAERRTCSLSPPASQPTSTHIGLGHFRYMSISGHGGGTISVHDIFGT